MDSRAIGNFIAMRRKDLGMTQQQLADKMEVTNKAVSKWETGEGYPDIANLHELSRILNVTIDELLKGESAYNGNGAPLTDGSALDIPKTEHKTKVKKFPFSWNSLFILVGAAIAFAAFLIDGVFQLNASSIGGYIEIDKGPIYVIAAALILGGFIKGILKRE